MPTLILLRHGQSQWNLENRFTGWWDVDLTDKGVAEAVAAGELLLAKGLLPTVAFTSVQTRAIKTLHLALEACGRLWIPETKDWRLNERHYGGLTGLDKAETAAKHGDEQVKVWRRSFDVPPPVLEPGGPYDLAADPRYPHAAPGARSLRPTVDPGDQGLATERAALRRAYRAQQGRDRAKARRRTGPAVAPQLRRAAAAAGAWRTLRPRR